MPQQHLSPAEVLFSMDPIRLKIPESVRLLESEFAIKQLIEAINKGGDFETPERVQSYLAINRISYRVHMRELEAWQYYFLLGCRSATINESTGYAASICGITSSEILARLSIWLPLAVDQQLVIVA